MRSRRSAGTARDNGGLPARRAIARWSWRLFQREWRRQLLVLGLLTVAVAAAIGIASVAYNVAAVPGNAEFGTANHFFRFDEPDAAALPVKLAAAEEWFGTIDAIGHRFVSVPGSVDTVDYRSQDPGGAYGDPLLNLVDGRYPAAETEVAVSDRVAETFDLAIDDTFALDGVSRKVVGLVENPSDLGEQFVLQAPSALPSSDYVLMLVDATPDRVGSFRPPGDTHRITSSRTDVAEDVVAAVSVLAVATVALFFVALVAAASFIVLAQSRQRQLGMLSAMGATEKHLRLVTVANGAVTGAVAALLGALTGVIGWVVLASRMEAAIGHRVDALNVPWWLVATSMLLAVAAAAGAAWWPARTTARVPTVQALSGRPPEATPVHRSAVLAGIFVLGGVVLLALAGDVADEVAVHWWDLLLVAVGTLCTVIGILLVSPLAIRALARSASRLPIAVRLPLRDLDRYQARSSAALAAISLVLGILVTIVVAASAAENTADAGNLSDRQLLVRAEQLDGPFAPLAADVEALQRGVDRVVAALDDPILIPIHVAVDPSSGPLPDVEGRLAVALGVRSGDGWRDVTTLYVAAPELLELRGIDPAAIDPTTEILTSETGELRILGAFGPSGAGRSDPEVVKGARSLPPTYSSLPGSFITVEGLDRRGWEPVPSGRWLVETNEPLTAEKLATIRDLAADAGLTIESRDHQEGLTRLASGATLIGIALALGVLAMTVGLIRSEAAGEVRTLTATGASSATRRMLTAATAGGLALLGVVLGIAGAYIALSAANRNDLPGLWPVPFTHLALIAIGTPLLAAGAGWLLAGREPSGLARLRIE